MKHLALTVIREEHAALAAMLHSLPMLLAEYRRHGRPPDFSVLRAMLFYVDEFPERRHHAQESRLLFPALRAHGSADVEVLDRLEREHARGEAAIRELEHALLAWEVLGEPRRAGFEEAADRYVDFYLEHMRLEETVVLPMAERCLTPAQWQALDEAFASNRDPLTGHEPEDVYKPLFRQIVMKAPAPVGLGAAV